MKKDSIIGKPKQVFKKVQKTSNQTETPKTSIPRITSVSKYGSVEALEKANSFFMPGSNFGRFRGNIPRKTHKRELGYPGLEIYGGYVFEEFLTELRGPRGIQMYEQMRREDAVVGAMLLVVEQLIHNAAVIVDPSEENPDAQESQMARDLVRTGLHDMGETWTDTLSEILSFLCFGFSTCAVWHKRRNGWHRDKWKSSRYTDNKWGWAGISLRSQTTLERWVTTDNGRPIGMVQLGPPHYTEVYIPFTHAAHFRTTTARDDPEGISVLRNAYRAYWMKRHLEEVETIGQERDLTGLPVLTVPENLDLWNPNDPDAAATLQRAEDIVRLTRVDKYGGHVLPYGWKLEIMTTPGQRAHNSDAVISRWDQRIAVTLLADMLLIGQQNVGSFALVQGKIKLFSSALEAYAARVAGVFNRDLIPRLMMLNGIPQEYWPSMRFGPVETPSLVDLAEYIKSMSEVGIPMDEGIALYLRHVANLPMPKKGEKAIPVQQPTEDAPEPTNDLEPPSNDDSNDDSDDDSDGEESSVDKKLKKGIIIRNNPIERFSVGYDE